MRLLPHRDANPQEHRRDRATLTHGANPGQATGTRASATQPLTKPHRAAGQAGLALHRFALPARETYAGTRKQARVVCFAAPSLCDPKQARACGASTRSLLASSGHARDAGGDARWWGDAGVVMSFWIDLQSAALAMQRRLSAASPLAPLIRARALR